MFPHVLLMVCGINMAVYCHAAQKRKGADRPTSELLHCRQGSDSALLLHNNQRKDTKNILTPIWSFTFL